MRPGGWSKPHPLVVDIKGMTISESMPMNRDHSEKLVGHGSPIKSADKLTVDGIFSFPSNAEEIIESHKNGFPWQASMEATIGDVAFVPTGKTTQANGRVYAGPVYVARKSELTAGSFVPRGADRHTSVEIAATAGDTKNMTDFEKWLLETYKIEASTLSDEQVKAFEAQHEAIKADAADAVADEAELDPIAAHREALAAVEEHAAMVAQLCGDRHPQIRATAIREGWDQDKVELAVLKAEQASELERIRAGRATGGVAIHTRSASDVLDNNVLAAAIHRDNFHTYTDDNSLVSCYGEKTLDLADRLPKSIGFHYLMAQVIRAAGGHVEPGIFGREQYSQAVQADRYLRGQAIFANSTLSSFSLTGVLSNLANKRLSDFYRSWPSVVERLCAVMSKSDFKTYTAYRMDGDLMLKPLSAAGEISHGTLSETSWTSKLETQARMIVVSRQDLINDDLGAFSRRADLMSERAMATREKDFFTLLLNPVGSFFNASGNPVINLKTGYGNGATMTVASLKDAKNLMASMKTAEGLPAMIMPEIVLCGTQIVTDAENLLNKTTVSLVGSSSTVPAGTLQVMDQFRGKFALVDTPWLDASNAITNSDDDTWFLFGSKAYAAYEYSQLNGQGPRVDSADADFNTDGGVQMKIVWDYGFNQADPRGVVKITQ